MKSFSDDLPNLTKEEVSRASSAAEEAASVAKVALGAATDTYDAVVKNTAVISKTYKLTKINMSLLVFNVVVSMVTLGVLVATTFL